jgi:hypothetical protein
MNTNPTPKPPQPHPPPSPDALPHPITFFTTARERSAILKALRRLAPDRRTALCKSLGIKTDTTDSPNSPTAPSAARRADGM